jgi:hypothetical protein
LLLTGPVESVSTDEPLLKEMKIDEIRERLAAMMEEAERGEGAKVLERTREFDTLVRLSGDELKPRLRHFLERRSYGKALEYLGGGEQSGLQPHR